MHGLLPIGRRPERIRAACRRLQDPALTALLVAQVLLIFVMEPLAAEGFEIPVAVTTALSIGLILLLVFGSHQRWALNIVIVAGGIRLLAAGADFVWMTSITEEANAVTAILALLALMWVVSAIVFGPGRVTPHRVRGAIVLYLTIALVFAWLYRLIATAVPGAFTGLAIRPGEVGILSPFAYYSLTTLTTVGFGDVTPVNAFARNLTMFEALLGQLYPAIILARVLTLYADDRKRTHDGDD